MSDETAVDADDSTASDDGLRGGVLALGLSELGSMTDGVTEGETNAVEVGPTAVLDVHPATRMSIPAEIAPARSLLPRFMA